MNFDDIKPIVRTSNRSPSAIVTPFNYNPPTANIEHDDKRSSLASLKPTSKIAKTVRRNDSYVSSMGRGKPDDNVVNNEDQDTSQTSSVVVTLV